MMIFRFDSTRIDRCFVVIQSISNAPDGSREYLYGGVGSSIESSSPVERNVSCGDPDTANLYIEHIETSVDRIGAIDRSDERSDANDSGNTSLRSEMRRRICPLDRRISTMFRSWHRFRIDVSTNFGGRCPNDRAATVSMRDEPSHSSFLQKSSSSSLSVDVGGQRTFARENESFGFGFSIGEPVSRRL